MNPYIVNAPQMQNQDPQGLNPVFQNANNQQQFMNQQLGQGNQLGQYHNYGSSGNGNNMALAMALRQGQGTPALGQTTNYFGKVISDPTYGAGADKYNNMTPDETANMMQYGV